MKNLIVASLMVLGFLSTSAQNKIGYINTEELISVMPEAEKANAELQEYQESLAKQGQEKGQEADTKAMQFVKDSATLSGSMKEIKRNEIIKLYQEVENWQQIAQQQYNQKAQQKTAPIRSKAQEAIVAVAKENGYTYILDINSLIYGPPGDDIIALVKKKLGIKDPPPAAKKPTAVSGKP
jgi:outer membrane protein